jgi:hypothetical protein
VQVLLGKVSLVATALSQVAAGRAEGAAVRPKQVRMHLLELLTQAMVATEFLRR